MSADSKTYCPLAWNHFSTYTSGHMRLCCNSSENSRIKDNNGKTIKINQVTNLVEYFNLDHYKRIRSNMIQGIENPECKNCYDIEKNQGKSVRQYFIERWPFWYLEDLTNLETGEVNDVIINSLDLSWSNKCNLKCRMCSPWASDQLIKETKDLNLSSIVGVDASEVDIAFDFNQQWSYENIMPVLEQVMTPALSEILVTGGEPLINNEFFALCNSLVDRNYAKNVRLSFHTNLTVMPQKWIDVLAKFRTVTFKISIDGEGECYEYIRYPGKWNIIKNNIDELANLVAGTHTNFQIEFHTVLAIFNVAHLTDLFDYLLTLPNNSRIRKLPHFNYINEPWYASPGQLPANEKLDAFTKIETWLTANATTHNLDPDKVSILRAVINIMIESSPDRQIGTMEIIKKVDKYRGHDTKKHMPWIIKKET
jgi:sulfatase maturation enzyme AslB (radical SAM superfamily)